MSLSQFDLALDKSKEHINFQYEDINQQIEKYQAQAEKGKPSIKALTHRKHAILKEEKQFWLEQLRKIKAVSTKVIERVQGVVQEAITELELDELED